MSERIPRHEQHDEDADALGRQLRYEADATRPAFSPELHERLRQAIRQPRKKGSELFFGRENSSDPFFRRRWPLWAGTVAAAAVLAVAITVWRTGDGQRKVSPAQASAGEEFVTVVAFGSEMPQRVGGLIDSALADRRWAYLDQDAQAAVDVLIRCLPTELPIAGLFRELPSEL